MRLITLTCTAIITAVLSVSVQSADFRKANWGMNLEQVQRLHLGELAANKRPGMIEYRTKLGDQKVFIYYRFNDLGQLSEAGYRTDESHTDLNLHISDYQTLNKLLQQKYPTTKDVAVVWKNRLFETKPEKWGRAITLGHVTFEWIHEIEGTRITHLLAGTRREINHRVRYESFRNEQDRQQLLDNL